MMKLILPTFILLAFLSFSMGAPRVPPCVHEAKECMKAKKCFGPMLLLDKLFEPEKSIIKRSGKKIKVFQVLFTCALI